VWKRDGNIRELPIRDGHNILDDNLLACSDNHIRAVFAMLSLQKKPAEFTGGLEAKRLRRWHVDALAKMRVKQMFFAYDTPDDWEPLRDAASMLVEAGFTRHKLRTYVLIGHPKDTTEKAEARLKQVVSIGMYPMAMLWRDSSGTTTKEWRRFQRIWSRPALIYARNAVNGPSSASEPQKGPAVPIHHSAFTPDPFPRV
jgi:hypothetical protein